jgi:ABC-type transport system involved in cytochrome bd biosynthesis fused ATPase/permease subunit
MLNHIYGIAGLFGLLITIVATYIQNEDISKWILIASGWFMCLIVAIASAWGVRKLSQNYLSKLEDVERLKDKVMKLNYQYLEEKVQREKAQDIAAFIVSENGYGKAAKPKAASSVLRSEENNEH